MKLYQERYSASNIYREPQLGADPDADRRKPDIIEQSASNNISQKRCGYLADSSQMNACLVQPSKSTATKLKQPAEVDVQMKVQKKSKKRPLEVLYDE